MYRSTVSSGTIVDPAKPSRNRRPLVSVMYANQPPRANSRSEDATNGRARRRSDLVSPGVTNLHSSYRTTGNAMASPENAAILNRIRNGSTTPPNTSLQCVGGCTVFGSWRRTLQYGWVISLKVHV